MKHISLITFLLFLNTYSSLVFATDNFLLEFPVEKITKNVYVIHGPIENPSIENKGFINNPAFIVTKSGVIVIDPGSSKSIGEMLLVKIKQISQLPVIAIFNTHEHGDHWMANQAITDKYPDIPIYAHPQMIQNISNGAGKFWFDLMQHSTSKAITGTEIVPPNHPLKNGDEIIFDDLTFRIHHNGISHTNNDIMIELVELQTVFLGDNAFINRLPRLDDGDVLGNINVLKEILKTSNKYYIPGHGPSGDKSVPETYLEYLTILYDSVKQLYEEDLSDFEMKEQIITKMQKFSDWYGFDSELGKNISLVYLQIENADF